MIVLALLITVSYSVLFGFLVYGNVGLYYAVNGCGEEQVYNEDWPVFNKECPVYIGDFNAYTTRLFWLSAFACLVTGPVSIINYEMYKRALKASISVAYSEDFDHASRTPFFFCCEKRGKRGQSIIGRYSRQEMALFLLNAGYKGRKYAEENANR